MIMKMFPISDKGIYFQEINVWFMRKVDLFKDILEDIRYKMKIYFKTSIRSFRLEIIAFIGMEVRVDHS